LIDSPTFGKFKLLPVSETKFVVEDLEHYAIFEFDDKGIPFRVTLHQTSRTGDLYSVIIRELNKSRRPLKSSS